MEKLLRVLEPKSFESIEDFCDRVVASNSDKIEAVGIYNGVVLTNKDKEKNLVHYKVKTLKIDNKKTEV